MVGRDAEPIAEMALELGVGAYLKIIPQIGIGKTDAGHDMFNIPPEEVMKIYKAADIFVSPSMLEGLPLTLLEAMAAGLPIVATDAPGCRDVLEHGITGLISPVADTSAMAENILRLLEDPALAENLGQNGKLRSGEYEWKKVALRYLEAYKDLI